MAEACGKSLGNGEPGGAVLEGLAEGRGGSLRWEHEVLSGWGGAR